VLHAALKSNAVEIVSMRSTANQLLRARNT